MAGAPRWKTMPIPSNPEVARQLRQAAATLAAQGANPFRVRAWRQAADTVAALPRNLAEIIAEGGAAALEALPGIGDSLAHVLLDMAAGTWSPPATAAEPPLALLLEVDAEYRRRAAANELPRIRPRHHNPAGAAWLPVLHMRRGAWQISATFSNTGRAHDLQRIGDWVVLRFHLPGGPEGQRTVVTETQGPLAGHRVVRGREDELGG